ncbi:Cytochrome P450 [Melia azedarach]|uniref:Cytochrome P450 n=1 Tax=Melia azedarach TaxID=155640 RepID=A0ACC1X7M8_MELAZ|nr:Cytochrome P450 [Melia azedarach]
MHKKPQAWENPLEFQPEMFLGDGRKGDYWGNNFNFLPFGSGRRICAGIPLAERMVLYVLSNLLHNFEWNLPGGKTLDLSEKFGIVLKKSERLMAIPTARSSSSEKYY